MRLIDADALLKEWRLECGGSCFIRKDKYCMHYDRTKGICTLIIKAPIIYRPYYDGRGGRMTINLIDARRGLHDKCLELFADKKIAEQIYRYLCDGIEDCEEAEPVKHGRWKVLAPGYDAICTNCEHYWIPNGDQYDYRYCPNCGARMDEVEE